MDFKVGLVHRGDRWKCLRCGDCCRTLRVDLNIEDLRKLGSLLDHKLDVYISNSFQPHIRSKGEKCKHFGCYFFDEESNLCTIYDLRPATCRCYPFLIAPVETILDEFEIDLKEDIIWTKRGPFVLFYQKDCKGFGVGELINREKIVELCLKTVFDFAKLLRVHWQWYAEIEKLKIIP
ncbi:MAG: YkgJ family cysteine cluster protein [Methanocellales archaeon]